MRDIKPNKDSSQNIAMLFRSYHISNKMKALKEIFFYSIAHRLKQNFSPFDANISLIILKCIRCTFATPASVLLIG